MSTSSRLVFIVSLALLLVSCGPKEEPARDVIRVPMLKYLSYIPLFIAAEEGYFEEAGLEIELIPTSRISVAIPSLIEGQVDVLPTSVLPAFFNVAERGGTMRAVAGKGYNAADGCAYSALTARKSLVEAGELDTPEDIVGRRVAIEPTGPTYYRVARYLEKAGLTLDDVERIDVPNPAKIGAFADDSMDITTASEPWLTRQLRSGEAVILAPSGEIIPDFQFGFILFGKTLLVDRPDLGERFVLAYLRAVRHLNETGKGHGHLELIARHTGLDEDLLEEACWPSIRNDARIDVEQLMTYQEWAIEQGLVSRHVPIEDLYDDRFIEYANAVIEQEESTP